MVLMKGLRMSKVKWCWQAATGGGRVCCWRVAPSQVTWLWPWTPVPRPRRQRGQCVERHNETRLCCLV